MLNFLDTVEMKKNLQLLVHHLLHPNLLLLNIDGLMEHQTKPEAQKKNLKFREF